MTRFSSITPSTTTTTTPRRLLFFLLCTHVIILSIISSSTTTTSSRCRSRTTSSGGGGAPFFLFANGQQQSNNEPMWNTSQWGCLRLNIGSLSSTTPLYLFQFNDTIRLSQISFPDGSCPTYVSSGSGTRKIKSSFLWRKIPDAAAAAPTATTGPSKFCFKNWENSEFMTAATQSPYQISTVKSTTASCTSSASSSSTASTTLWEMTHNNTCLRFAQQSQGYIIAPTTPVNTVLLLIASYASSACSDFSWIPAEDPPSSAAAADIPLLYAAIGGGVLVIIILVVVIYCCCCKKGKEDPDADRGGSGFGGNMNNATVVSRNSNYEMAQQPMMSQSEADDMLGPGASRQQQPQYAPPPGDVDL